MKYCRILEGKVGRDPLFVAIPAFIFGDALGVTSDEGGVAILIPAIFVSNLI